MKILMIDHFSQTNNYTIELCNELYKNIDLTLLTVDKAKLNKETPFKCKKVLCGYGHKKSLAILIYFKSLLLLIKEILFENYDGIHVQTFRNVYVEMVIYFILKPFIKKFIYTAHNILPHERRVLDKITFSLIYKFADIIIVHNNVSKVKLRELVKVNELKIRIIPHGIYNSFEVQGNFQRIKDKDRKNLLFLGGIRPYKGVDILISAIALLHPKYKQQITVTIAGKHLDTINYKKMIIDKGLEEVIDLISEYVPDDMISGYFAKADACVLPYREIYGSGALLLSYTFAKVVIVSDVPTFIEETSNGHTGFIFKNGDSQDLANKITDFLESDNKKIRTMEENIKEMVLNKYNWKISANLVGKVYERDIN